MITDPTPGAILRPARIQPVERGGGIVTRPLVGPRIGDVSFLSGITEFPAGAALGMHSHNCEESVMIISGHGAIDIDGDIFPLEVNDTTWVPADVPHRFINMSDSTTMTIFWTYASRDATRTIMASGETHTILSEHEESAS